MRNVTLAIEADLLERGREYARKHGISLNALIRELLRRRVAPEPDWTEDCFRKMDAAGGRSRGRTWKRADLYDA